MKNRLFLAWIALSLVLACTPARQVAEQRQPSVPPSAHRAPEKELAASPETHPKALAEEPQVPIQHFRQTPVAATTTAPAPVVSAPQPEQPVQPAPSGRHLAQAAAQAASTAPPAAPAPVIPENELKTQPLPTPETPRIQHEKLPEWVKERPETHEAAPETPPAGKPQAATVPASAPQSQQELLLLMEQMITEMEADSNAASPAALAAPYPGQVRQIGEVTIEYREEKPAAAPAPQKATAQAAETVAPAPQPLALASATQPFSDEEADEIMRRVLLRRDAAQAAPAPTAPVATPKAAPSAAIAAQTPVATPAPAGGMTITFMRAGEEDVIEMPASALPAETDALQIGIRDGRRIDLDEARLIEWEQALLARKQGQKPSVVLPTWLLQGLEWLAHAPSQEPQRSLTIMPLYRHMEAAGHLKTFDADKMSAEQVVRALRLLVDEAKSKKKLQGAAQQHPLTPDALLANDLTYLHKQELAQPSPVIQALSSEGQPSSTRPEMVPPVDSIESTQVYVHRGATSGTRFPATEKQEPGTPVTEFTFAELPADPVAGVPAFRSHHPVDLLAMASAFPERKPAYSATLAPMSPIPTEADMRITRRKEYVNKLTRFSVRAAYGFGQSRSTMQYELPNLEATIAEAVNSLKNQYAWVPWGQLTVPAAAPQRERILNKRGQFRISAGINVPLGFIEVEAGPGRFSQSAYSLQDFLPPWQGLDMARAGELMMQRVATPEAKTSMTFRAGTELERLLPEHLLPRLRWGKVSAGLDASAYYLTGTDLSYRVGTEILDPQAVDHLQDLFDPVPLIADQTKTQAAEAIVAHVESSLPGYFWLPALRGYGLGAKAYVNLNPRLRFAARYHYERSRGLPLESTDWMPRGPVVTTTSFSFGLETQL